MKNTSIFQSFPLHLLGTHMLQRDKKSFLSEYTGTYSSARGFQGVTSKYLAKSSYIFSKALANASMKNSFCGTQAVLFSGKMRLRNTLGVVARLVTFISLCLAGMDFSKCNHKLLCEYCWLCQVCDIIWYLISEMSTHGFRKCKFKNTRIFKSLPAQVVIRHIVGGFLHWLKNCQRCCTNSQTGSVV